MYLLNVRVFILNYPGTLINNWLKPRNYRSKYTPLRTYKPKYYVSLAFVKLLMPAELSFIKRYYALLWSRKKALCKDHVRPSVLISL
jgi:hypothetical protein